VNFGLEDEHVSFLWYVCKLPLILGVALEGLRPASWLLVMTNVILNLEFCIFDRRISCACSDVYNYLPWTDILPPSCKPICSGKAKLTGV
jgi:hypothetical protein